MLRFFVPTFVAVLLTLPTIAAPDPAKFTVKTAKVELPKELAEPIRALLSEQAVQVLDGDGKLFCEMWLRKELPVKAKEDDFKKALTYKFVEESVVVGAVRFAQEWAPFRKQDVKPGIYTLRHCLTRMDGDHQGTAPHSEFCVLAPAKLDQKADLLDKRDLERLSGATSGGSTNHPAAMLLVPVPKPADSPKLIETSDKIWAVEWKQPVTNGTQKGHLGIGFVLFGHSAAE